MKHHPLLLASAAALLLCSCETYDTPNTTGKAAFTGITNPHVKAAYSGKPAITFPAHIAVARVQNSSSNGYNIATARDIETAQDLSALSKAPGIAGVVSLNRLMVPDSATADDLRTAAARLHADAVLLYTVDSDSHDNDLLPPLTLATLGMAPNKTYKIASSASAVLIDTRTGYVYGVLEEGASTSGLTSAWGSDTTMDSARRKSERAAFEKLLASFNPFWNRLYARYHI